MLKISTDAHVSHKTMFN